MAVGGEVIQEGLADIVNGLHAGQVLAVNVTKISRRLAHETTVLALVLGGVKTKRPPRIAGRP